MSAKQMNPWDQLEGLPQDGSTSKQNPWDQLEGVPTKEGMGKGIARGSVQPFLGAAEMTGPGMVTSAWQLLGTGEALDELKQWQEGREGELRKKFPQAPWKEKPAFDEQKYLQALETASKTVPTVSNIASFIEQQTGLPLEAHTNLQKKLRLAGSAFKIRPGSIGAKTTAATVAPIAAAGLQKAGVPEPVADILGLGAGAVTPKPQIEKVIKPSGLTTRRFEKINKPTKITPSRHEKLTGKIEEEVKNLTDDLMKSHPTYQSIKNDPIYKEKIAEGFQKVSDLAEGIPNTFKKRNLTSFLNRRFQTHLRDMKGLTPSESEEIFRKDFRKILNKTFEGKEEFSVKNAVDQFRKNNNELSQYFEPGKSKAFNTGKRDALLEYNRGIQELFETALPESEFTKLFKEQNKRWSELSDINFIEEKLDNIFKDKKINFQEISKILDPSKSNLRRPFQRIMGKRGVENFENLMKDLQSIRNPYSLLKKAELGGFKELSKLLGSYIINPSLAHGYAAYNLAKSAMRSLIDKPELAITWKNGIDAFKKGNFQEAEKELKILDDRIKNVAEKVKSTQEKIKTLPEGFSEPVEPKVTSESLEKDFHFYPSKATLEDFNLTEKPIPLSSHDSMVFRNTYATLPKLPLKVFKNQWDKILNSKAFESYYSNFPKDSGNTSLIGTVGDFIKDPKIRKLYGEVLDVPVRKQEYSVFATAHYNSNKREIVIPEGYSPANFYSTLMHETHHAMQDAYKPHLLKPPYYTYPHDSAEGYFKNIAETKARQASRYVQKDLIKALETTKKSQEQSRRQFLRKPLSERPYRNRLEK